MKSIEELTASQESMANQLASMSRELASMRQATEQRALYARLAPATPLRRGAFPGGSEIAAAGTSEPGLASMLAPDSVTADTLATNSVTSDALAPGAVDDISMFAQTIRPPIVVGSLPYLPQTDYPQGSFVYLTSDAKLYRTDGWSWSAAVDGADIATRSIQADALIANSITAGEIAGGAITADQIHAGAITGDMITGSTIQGVNFIAGGGAGTQITVLDAGYGSIGYWDTNGLHVVTGRFFMENIALRVAESNSNSFWDFDGRAVRGTHGLVTFVSNGASSDGDMSNMTLNGSIGIDGSNGRIYYRYGGSWHYSAKTAGFEIPVHEAICPVCELPLLPGQDIIGRGDRLLPDGSLHGLYIHFGCAGSPMNMDIADDYDAVANHADLDANTSARTAHESRLDRLTRKARKAMGQP